MARGLVELLRDRLHVHQTDSDNWQVTGSYTLAYFKDASPLREQWFIGSNGISTSVR